VDSVQIKRIGMKHLVSYIYIVRVDSNIIVFECHNITMMYHDIFYINTINTCLKTKYFKS
jgi:hypothetical protein